LIFLERKMLKLLFKDAIKTPGTLLALCFVMYLASMSFFVAAFLLLLAARWLQKTIQQKAKAVEAAEAEAARAQAAKPAVAPATVAPTVAAANEATAAQPAPKRQYAKSAVVIPFKAGTRS
jgi:hypothetical protein